MSDGTAIEWADATLNFIKARRRDTGKVGDVCVKLSPACRFCYAEANNIFRGTGLPYKPGHLADVEIFLDEAKLLRPLAWRKPRRIFPLSLTDLFADFISDGMIDRFFAVAALTPQHIYMPLTKRSARMRAYLTDPDVRDRIGKVQREIDPNASAYENVGQDAPWPLPNVQLGVSAEDQPTANERVPDLLASPAAIRVVSAEPLLGMVLFELLQVGETRVNGLTGAVQTRRRYPDNGLGDYQAHGNLGARIDGIIVGGESGQAHLPIRPMEPEWVEAIRAQCERAGTAFFFKQWGAWGWAPADLNFEDAIAWGRLRYGGATARCFTSGRTAFRIGKGRAGRLLDGRTYDALPEALHGH